MTVDTGAVCRDPTLYRVLAFVGWSPQETDERSNARLRHLNEILRQLNWLPADQPDRPTGLPPRAQLAWRYRKLWDAWSELGESWAAHRFALATHEMVTLLLGLTEDGPHAEISAWVEKARGRWESYFQQEDAWETVLGKLNAEGHPALLGHVWLWTGEWEQEPTDGWEAFGRARYAENCIVFPWGVLGSATDQDAPDFEVHTAVGVREQRDQFLFVGLGMILTEYVKATQYHRQRYEQAFGPMVDRQEARIAALTAPVGRPGETFSLEATDRAVRQLTQELFVFSQDLADLEYDVRGVEIARTAIATLLQASKGVSLGGSLLVEPVDRLARQMSMDLAYLRTTERHAQVALQTHQILVDVENTRAENRLAVLGIILGTAIALAQVLGGKSFALALTVSLAGVALALGYYLWSRRRRI